MKTLLFLILLCGLASPLQAATVPATDCTRAAVAAAYAAASAGDTITVPAGDCDASNQWNTSYINLAKANLTVLGAGQGVTIIGISGTQGGFQITANNVTITGFTFDCNNHNTSNHGINLIGTTGADPSYTYSEFRIHHNIYNNCGDSAGDTGYDALSIFGNVYGLIDHNIFNNCTGECLNICADGVLGTGRSMAFGNYTNGTVFIEDNTFNYTLAQHYENLIDSNSSSRWTFRYNTLDFTSLSSQGGHITNAILSNHETCARCTGSTGAGDVGSAVYEMYENTIKLGANGYIRSLMQGRAGKGLVYNNHITKSGGTQYVDGIELSNYRSKNYAGVGFCGLATYGRSMAAECHEVDVNHAGYSHEGLIDAQQTTLNGAIVSGDTTITLTSTSGYSANGVTNGYAIRIDNEVLQWTGVSGNQLTGVTRGVSGGQSAASHSNGATVKYIALGGCDAQINNTYIYNNDINSVVTSALNDATVDSGSFSTLPDYTGLDIKSFVQRPNNWQYQAAASLSYTPYAYPHPLQGITSTVPQRFRMIRVGDLLLLWLKSFNAQVSHLIQYGY